MKIMVYLGTILTQPENFHFQLGSNLSVKFICISYLKEEIIEREDSKKLP